MSGLYTVTGVTVMIRYISTVFSVKHSETCFFHALLKVESHMRK